MHQDRQWYNERGQRNFQDYGQNLGANKWIEYTTQDKVGPKTIKACGTTNQVEGNITSVKNVL